MRGRLVRIDKRAGHAAIFRDDLAQNFLGPLCDICHGAKRLTGKLQEAGEHRRVYLYLSVMGHGAPPLSRSCRG